MFDTFRQTLTLMWQGMLSIFVVITLIYGVLRLLSRIFREKGRK